VPSPLTNWGRPQTDVDADQTKAETKIAPKIRLIALGLDFIMCYFLAVLATLTPLLNRVVEFYGVLIVLFLSRDYFFQGRGVGKNLMGLQVVDAQTGKPATLMQSALRNIILTAPFVAVEISSAIIRFTPIAWLNAAVTQFVYVVCAIYVALVLPLESYRALTRADGLRKGDELAGTTIVEAPMDFSHPL
jgi:hypothetical protein